MTSNNNTSPGVIKTYYESYYYYFYKLKTGEYFFMRMNFMTGNEFNLIIMNYFVMHSVLIA